ncbi:metal-dependent phosphohydrolase [Plantactinospora siamensis]|uniref:Metal-dependent phosphohydrolase n=1 Tax=Plantactinospora siamensis TaxID=555372 RepID=A0ABV6P649_9ACTN
MTALIDRWTATALAAGCRDRDAVTGVGTELLHRWREPHRQYHTEAHLRAVLSTVDEHAGAAADADLVRLAAWCHDAVYDCHAAAGHNERESAALAGTLLVEAGLPDTRIVEVERLVLLTATHRPEPGDRNGGLLCDADLAVLAGQPDEYDRYAAAVRREYAHVPDPLFRVGRATVLRELLALPELYRLPELAARWTEPARANMRRELAALTAAT